MHFPLISVCSRKHLHKMTHNMFHVSVARMKNKNVKTSKWLAHVYLPPPLNLSRAVLGMDVTPCHKAAADAQAVAGCAAVLMGVKVD